MASEKASKPAKAENKAQAVPDTKSASDGGLKEVKVLSVELADAVAKDKPNYKSHVQISLYLFMLLDTLSKYYRCHSMSHRRIESL